MSRLFRLSLLLAAVTLIGCSPQPGVTARPQGAQAGATPSAMSGADTAQPSTTPQRPAATTTASPTAAPLASPTSTADQLRPGSYDVHGCASSSGSNGKLTLCIESVTVLPNQHLQFMVSWELSNAPKGSTVTKPSDAGNERLYLVDEQGRTYHLTGVGGAAAEDTLLHAGKAVSGWFEFEAPAPGARTFEFRDEENQLVIKSLQLGEQIGDAAAYELVNYPLQLSYSTAHWEPGQEDDGSPELVNMDSPGCTIRDLPSAEPQGKFKNELKLGELTYQIYGFFDPQRDVWLREYVAVRLPPTVESAADPLLLVQIPTKNTLACILAASDVLATLTGKTPGP